MLLDREKLNNHTIKEIRAVLDEMKKSVNALTYELSPLVLRQMGLWSALEWVAKNLKQRYDLQIRLKGNESATPLDENVGVVLFRAIREILINVAKHAGTGFASVSVRESDNALEVSIRDTGKGFDLNDQSGHVGAGHFGLFSVRERLKYIGGSLSIRSRPGAGTTVTLRVPYKSRN
jgi:signal transduction histidine kinase